MIKKTTLLLFVITLIYVGCKKEYNVNSLYGKWEFKCFDKQGISITESQPDGLEKMTIEFLENGEMRLGGICNGGSGTFEANNSGILKISQLLLTSVGCDGLDWETRYISALESSTEYYFYNKKLKICFENTDKKDILIFTKL